MNRRAFLPCLLAPALATLEQQGAAHASSAPAMKVTRIDTTYWRAGVEPPWKPNWVWVRVHTDSGLVGLGETYPRNEAEASLVHSAVASFLLGRDPLVSLHWISWSPSLFPRHLAFPNHYSVPFKLIRQFFLDKIPPAGTRRSHCAKFLALPKTPLTLSFGKGSVLGGSHAIIVIITEEIHVFSDRR